MESKSPSIDRSKIAETAYFLWLERGGSDVVNWLEAEARLRQDAAQLKPNR